MQRGNKASHETEFRDCFESQQHKLHNREGETSLSQHPTTTTEEMMYSSRTAPSQEIADSMGFDDKSEDLSVHTSTLGFNNNGAMVGDGNKPQPPRQQRRHNITPSLGTKHFGRQRQKGAAVSTVSAGRDIVTSRPIPRIGREIAPPPPAVPSDPSNPVRSPGVERVRPGGNPPGSIPPPPPPPPFTPRSNTGSTPTQPGAQSIKPSRPVAGNNSSSSGLSQQHNIISRRTPVSIPAPPPAMALSESHSARSSGRFDHRNHARQHVPRPAVGGIQTSVSSPHKQSLSRAHGTVSSRSITCAPPVVNRGHRSPPEMSHRSYSTARHSSARQSPVGSSRKAGKSHFEHTMSPSSRRSMLPMTSCPPSPRSLQSWSPRQSRRYEERHQQPQPVQIEIMPGMFSVLRGSQETLDAVQRGAAVDLTCLDCATDMFCIVDAAYALCPECKVVNPLLGEEDGHGIGLGLRKNLYQSQNY